MNKNKINFVISGILSLLISMSLIPAQVFAGEVPPGHVHSMEQVKAVKPTCSTVGKKAYYHCKTCDNNYLDAKGNTEVAADESNITVPIDPNAHKWDKGKITRKATLKKKGVKTFTCQYNSKHKRTEPIKYIGPVGKKFKLDGKQVQFKTKVVQLVHPFMEKSDIDRVWLTAGKKYMKVNWKNPKKMKYVDGVIILRKTGKNGKVYKEVGRVKSKKKDGTLNTKLYFTDKTAKKKNTPYTYIAVVYHVEDNLTYIAHVSDWAGGQTSASKQKTVNKAKINIKTSNLQVGDEVKLKVKYANPYKTYNRKSFRWLSRNSKVAKVNKKGNVTAVAPGTTKIRVRLSSGNDITSKVSVVGAFEPKAPNLKVDVADTSSITLKWNSVKHADSYILYRSDDGLHWDKSYKVNGTTKKVKGLKKGHRYTFYVIARNDNRGYRADSTNSNVVYQKAVEKLRVTKVKGFPTSKSVKAGTKLSVSLKITAPEGRKAYLQMKRGKKWVTEKTVRLPKGTERKSYTLTFPNDWWGSNTKWRLYIPKNKTASKFTSKTLAITSLRRYQNPSSYIQISDSISKHGHSYYVSPIRVDDTSTKNDHINALITTAAKYKGTNYVQGRSSSPGNGIDESGLIIQACYGAGVDLWPISPDTRPSNCVPSIMKSDLKKIKYKAAEDGSDNYLTMTRGDLVFFSNSKGGTAISVAIYEGWGKIILADAKYGSVHTTTIRDLEDKEGNYGYYVVGVRRIFN